MLPSLMAEKWQKTSSPPPSGVMKPKPRSFHRPAIPDLRAPDPPRGGERERSPPRGGDRERERDRPRLRLRLRERSRAGGGEPPPPRVGESFAGERLRERLGGDREREGDPMRLAIG
jgi:hypothetical protein